MTRIRLTTVLLLAGLLPGCATIIDGSTQNLTVSTEPAGATCTLDREGMRVAIVSPTPGTIRIDKSKRDIAVSCRKPGFQTAQVGHVSGFRGTTFGNLILGGGVGFIVDASTGASFEYPPEVKVAMAPEPGQLPPMAGGMMAVRPVSVERVAQPGRKRPNEF